jgi:hypothetical protein
MRNLREEILKEHSKRQTMKIANEYRVTQRAAWAVSYCAIANQQLIKKHLKKMIVNLRKPVHVAVKRNTVKVLSEIEIPKPLHGITADVCFNLLNDAGEPIAVRVHSMTVLSNLCRHHPELKNELRISIKALLPHASAGLLSRAKNIMAE